MSEAGKKKEEGEEEEEEEKSVRCSSAVGNAMEHDRHVNRCCSSTMIDLFF